MIGLLALVACQPACCGLQNKAPAGMNQRGHSQIRYGRKSERLRPIYSPSVPGTTPSSRNGSPAYRAEPREHDRGERLCSRGRWHVDDQHARGRGSMRPAEPPSVEAVRKGPNRLTLPRPLNRNAPIEDDFPLPGRSMTCERSAPHGAEASEQVIENRDLQG